MKIMKKLVSIVALIALCGGMAFAAGQQESGSAAAASDSGLSGKLRVQLIGDFKEEDTTNPVSGQKVVGVHYLKEQFEKLYPGVEVEFVLMGWDSYTQKTIVMAQADEADVFQVPGIATLAAQDLMEPLASYIEKDGFDLSMYIDNQVEGWMAMGSQDTELQVYGLPFIGDTRFISYDKKLFDDWGVEYLSAHPTLDELMKKGKAMTGKNPRTGEQNYGLRFTGGKYAADSAMNISEGLGNVWGTGFKWTEMTINFDTPEMIKAVQWMKDIQAYCPPGNLARQGDEKMYTPDNNIAINIQDNPSSLKKIEALGWGDRIGISFLFKNEEYDMGNMFAGSPACIGANSKVKDIAWEWLKFTASETYQKYFWDQYRSLPTVKAAMNWDSITALPQVETVLETMGYLWVPRYPYRASQPRTIIGVQVEKAMLGEMSPAEAMKAAQAEADAWLKEQ